MYKRIYSAEKLSGRSIEDVVIVNAERPPLLIISTIDGKFIVFSTDEDGNFTTNVLFNIDDIDNSSIKKLGILTDDELEKRRTEKKNEELRRQELSERQEYERLKKKFENLITAAPTPPKAPIPPEPQFTDSY